MAKRSGFAALCAGGAALAAGCAPAFDASHDAGAANASCAAGVVQTGRNGLLTASLDYRTTVQREAVYILANTHAGCDETAGGLICRFDGPATIYTFPEDLAEANSMLAYAVEAEGEHVAFIGAPRAVACRAR